MDFITYAAAVAAAKKMGGGGGGVGSWNDLSAPMPTKFLPDGYPHEGETGMVAVLPLTVLDMSNGGNLILPYPLGLVAGKTYTVKWRGVEYASVAREVNDEYGSAVVIGRYNDDLEQDKPYCVSDEGNMSAIVSFDNYKPATCSITTEGTEVIPIDSKYLPKGLPWLDYGVLLEESEAAEYTHSTLGKAWEILKAPDLVAGEPYRITYNGTEYDCICQPAPAGFSNDANAVAMGNFYVAGGENTGEPFAMLISHAYQRVDIIDLSGASSVKIKIYGKSFHRIDKICLPNDIPAVFWVDVEVGSSDILLKNTTFAGIVNAIKNGLHAVCKITYTQANRLYQEFYSVSKVDENTGVFFKGFEVVNHIAIKTVTINPDNSVDMNTTNFSS